MDFEVWVAFVVATIIVTALPGPTMLLVMAHAIVVGPKRSMTTIAGVLLADVILLCLSFFGIGAVLYASTTAFKVMKWAGAFYLIYIGVQQWRTAPEKNQIDFQPAGLRSQTLFLHGFLSTMFNPKLIGFFLAFFPQFIKSDGSMALQLGVLGITFLFFVFLIMTGYGLAASRVRQWFFHKSGFKTLHKVSGGTLIGAGFMAAMLRQA